jgi:hypothetical protein
LRARNPFPPNPCEPVGSPPEEFGAVVKSEMTRLGKIIREAGIRDE